MNMMPVIILASMAQAALLIKPLNILKQKGISIHKVATTPVITRAINQGCHQGGSRACLFDPGSECQYKRNPKDKEERHEAEPQLEIQLKLHEKLVPVFHALFTYGL